MEKVFEYAALLEWYHLHGRHHLPWRAFENLPDWPRTYRIWLSEILLQQTQADRVIGFYNRILEQYPNIEDLAKVAYEEFFPYYQGLGYYSRARNLLACAREVVARYGWIFPRDTALLRSLPGIGPYTAEAIRAFGYDIPTLSFDTNLEKIFCRYYHGSRFIPLTGWERASILEDYLALGEVNAREVNAALMDLGALWSTNSHEWIDWSRSPFIHCLFSKTQGSLEIAPIKVRSYFPVLDAQTLVIIHRDHKQYFSEGKDDFSPFLLNPISTLPTPPKDTRHYVQEYFREHYGLELSVRPARKQWYIQGIPTQIVFAQVQSGKIAWSEYTKTEAKITDILAKIEA